MIEDKQNIKRPRGRPKLENPTTPTERSKKSRENRMEEGYRPMWIWLGKDGAKYFDSATPLVKKMIYANMQRLALEHVQLCEEMDKINKTNPNLMEGFLNYWNFVNDNSFKRRTAEEYIRLHKEVLLQAVPEDERESYARAIDGLNESIQQGIAAEKNND